MTNNQDPFEDVVLHEQQKLANMARLKQSRQDKFNATCKEAAQKIATEIRTIGSPLHTTISEEIRMNGIKTNKFITREWIPVDLRNYFNTLSQCYAKNYTNNSTEAINWKKNIIDKEFDGISGSLTIHATGIHGNSIVEGEFIIPEDEFVLAIDFNTTK